MEYILISFFISFIATFFIVRVKHVNSQISGGLILHGPQNFHSGVVPRIGGISIFIGLFASILLLLVNHPDSTLNLKLLACASPAFLIGLTEDITQKISIRVRLFFTAVSGILFVSIAGASITKLDILGIDFLISIPLVGILFTILAITGLANAYNIIDGFNGLASMVGIINLLGIAYLGLIFSDFIVVYLCLLMVSAIIGFFVWNYPRGLIFLGDGGAYLIGFWVAALSILITCRHREISPWFALMINAYPVLETLFSIYRRLIHQRINPGLPDGTHFHTLIYRRILMSNYRNKNLIVANSKTAPYLWALTVLSITPALIWWDSTFMLMLANLFFMIFYIWLYRKIVIFRTPTWLRILR